MTGGARNSFFRGNRPIGVSGYLAERERILEQSLADARSAAEAAAWMARK